MVNAKMFGSAIPRRNKPKMPPVGYAYPQQPIQYPQPGVPVAQPPYYPQQPAQPPRAPAPYDPEVEKMRLTMMKILFWVVGGSAITLIVWRVILKFL